MKKIYYWVPQCPICGSKRTGRFVFPLPLQKYQLMVDACRNDELILFYEELKDETAFCADCGHEWNAKIEVRYLSESERKEEGKLRGVKELYSQDIVEEAYDQDNYLSKKRKWSF